MRLAEFILANVETILQDWEEFARSLAPGGVMDAAALRDDAESILRASVRDMGMAQSHSQQSAKAKGHGGAGGAASDILDDASSVHGVGRVGSGFNLGEVVAEYRALRASVLRLWRESLPQPELHDLDDVTRFNEAIDQSLSKAVESYARRVDQSRRMFLAILSHDLRNPLNCISMSAQAAAMHTSADGVSSKALSQIETSVDAISRLVRDLLDFAAAGLGDGIPLAPTPVNIGQLGREVVGELSAAHPNRTLNLEAAGELTCTCDGSRMRQVISNLLGNAIEHGADDCPIECSIQSEGPDVVLLFKNQGTPIPVDLLPTIFDPLVRDMSPEAQLRRRAGSVGLGLFIAHEIVVAHGGTIKVTSSPGSGTAFTVRIPQRPAQG